MTDKEELELILRLLKKHGLPLSPILEYSIQERLSLYQEESNSVAYGHVCEELSSHKERIPLIEYEKMFANLNVNVHVGKAAPNKAILLLLTIKLLEDEELIENCIISNKTLSKAFDEQWQYYFKNSKTPSAWTPYYRMRTEPFWHFKSNGCNELIDEINREPDKMTIGKLRSLIKYAYIDESLWEYLHKEYYRRRLREILVNNYIKQHF